MDLAEETVAVFDSRPGHQNNENLLWLFWQKSYIFVNAWLKLVF